MTNSQLRAEVTSRGDAWEWYEGGMCLEPLSTWTEMCSFLSWAAGTRVLTEFFFVPFWCDKFHNKNGKIKTHSFKINSFVNICQISLLKSCSPLKDQRAHGQGITFSSTAAALVTALTLHPSTSPFPVLSKVLICTLRNSFTPSILLCKSSLTEILSTVRKRDRPAS